MANTSIYQKVVAISPNMEMFGRRLYYFMKPIADKIISNKRPKNLEKEKEVIKKDFTQILKAIKNAGLKNGDILIVHSSFSNLKKFGLTPTQINDLLLQELGEKGTLAMPAIQIYPNEVEKPAISEEELLNQRYVYELKSTNIWTGALPKELINRTNSIRSKHPLNSMITFGKEASAICKDNELEKYPNGDGSSWNYCCKRNAFILGLGTDLTHSLTMIHVAEDVLGENGWHIKDWYQDRVFRLKTDEIEIDLYVKERKHKWGKFYFGERTLAKDLIKGGILKTQVVEDTVVETMRAGDLINYLNKRNRNGYPYFWLGSNLRKH